MQVESLDELKHALLHMQVVKLQIADKTFPRETETSATEITFVLIQYHAEPIIHWNTELLLCRLQTEVLLAQSESVSQLYDHWPFFDDTYSPHAPNWFSIAQALDWLLGLSDSKANHTLNGSRLRLAEHDCEGFNKTSERTRSQVQHCAHLEAMRPPSNPQKT